MFAIFTLYHYIIFNVVVSMHFVNNLYYYCLWHWYVNKSYYLQFWKKENVQWWCLILNCSPSTNAISALTISPNGTLSFATPTNGWTNNRMIMSLTLFLLYGTLLLLSLIVYVIYILNRRQLQKKKGCLSLQEDSLRNLN